MTLRDKTKVPMDFFFLEGMLMKFSRLVVFSHIMSSIVLMIVSGSILLMSFAFDNITFIMFMVSLIITLAFCYYTYQVFYTYNFDLRKSDKRWITFVTSALSYLIIVVTVLFIAFPYRARVFVMDYLVTSVTIKDGNQIIKIDKNVSYTRNNFCYIGTDRNYYCASINDSGEWEAHLRQENVGRVSGGFESLYDHINMRNCQPTFYGRKCEYGNVVEERTILFEYDLFFITRISLHRRKDINGFYVPIGQVGSIEFYDILTTKIDIPEGLDTDELPNFD